MCAVPTMSPRPKRNVKPPARLECGDDGKQAKRWRLDEHEVDIKIFVGTEDDELKCENGQFDGSKRYLYKGCKFIERSKAKEPTFLRCWSGGRGDTCAATIVKTEEGWLMIKLHTATCRYVLAQKRAAAYKAKDVAALGENPEGAAALSDAQSLTKPAASRVAKRKGHATGNPPKKARLRKKVYTTGPRKTVQCK